MGKGYPLPFRLVPAVRLMLAGAVVAGLVATILLVAQMQLLSRTVRNVLIGHQQLSDIVPLLALTAAVMALRAVLIGVRELLSRRAAVRTKELLRGQLAGHLLRLGAAYINGQRTGELVAAATDGIEKLDPYVSRYLPQTVLSAVVPLIIVIAILPVDPLSAGLLVFTAPIIVMLMILIGLFTSDHVQQQWQTLGRLSTAFLDVLQGMPTLVLLDRDAAERRRVARISEQFRDRTLSVLKVAFLSGAVLELMSAAGIGLIATVLGIRLLDGTMPFDRAFFVFLLTPEFYRPLRDLGTHRHAAIEGSAAAERIGEILSTPDSLDASAPSASVVAGSEARQRAPVSVHLDDVSYTYPQREQPALVQLTLSLPAGSCTAVVGRSGAGKSTLVDLLWRVMDPTEGVITVDGVQMRTLPVHSWRERVALVPQRPYLFHGTIRDNIRLACPDAAAEEVERAAELAGCLPFIAEMPRGLDTVIGERGEGLSAGQRQRLAIARAFLKNAPLLMLDEPTSALDPESEAQIRAALTLLMQNRTVLVVAHRMATVRAADRVVVLEAGRLREQGLHDELVRRDGPYAGLMSDRRRQEITA